MEAAPPGFTRHDRDAATLVLRADVADALLAAGLDRPEHAAAEAVRRHSGRGTAFGLDVPGVGPVFVRPYLHGGLLRRVTGDLWSSDRRFLAELRVLLAAAAAGIAVAEPLGIVTRSAGLGLRRGWLLAREVLDSSDALAWLAAGPPPAERRAVLGRAGRALRALHDAGFEHPDLHLKNLLLAPGGEVLVLDMDAARRHPRLSRTRRLAGLFRFDRYAAKQAATGQPVSRSDRLRVLRAYAGGDWPERPEVRALAERLATHIARHRIDDGPGAGLRRQAS